LNLKHGALQDPLKPQRRLHLAIFVGDRNPGRGFVDVQAQIVTQRLLIRVTRAQYFAHARCIENGQQQVLHGEKLVAIPACLHEGLIDAGFKFGG
jgi:hypothetical protein